MQLVVWLDEPLDPAESSFSILESTLSQEVLGLKSADFVETTTSAHRTEHSAHSNFTLEALSSVSMLE